MTTAVTAQKSRIPPSLCCINCFPFSFSPPPTTPPTTAMAMKAESVNNERCPPRIFLDLLPIEERARHAADVVRGSGIHSRSSKVNVIVCIKRISSFSSAESGANRKDYAAFGLVSGARARASHRHLNTGSRIIPPLSNVPHHASNYEFARFIGNEQCVA